jgi:hypothetical protein
MSDDAQVQRSRLARRVYDLWGEDRANADVVLIESASQALARISAMQVDATTQLDDDEERPRE